MFCIMLTLPDGLRATELQPNPDLMPADGHAENLDILGGPHRPCSTYLCIPGVSQFLFLEI